MKRLPSLPQQSHIFTFSVFDNNKGENRRYFSRQEEIQTMQKEREGAVLMLKNIAIIK